MEKTVSTTYPFAYLLLVILVVSLVIHRQNHPTESTTPAAYAATAKQSLQLTVTDDREFVRPGEEVTMRLVLASQNQLAADNLTLTVTIPDYLVPFETSPASDANPDTRTITWKNVSVTPDREAHFGIRARIAAETPLKTHLTTQARVVGPHINSSVTDLTTVDEVSVVSEAARTVARTPRAQTVAPTAQTGPSGGIAVAVTALLASIVIVTKNRKLVASYFPRF